MKLFTKSMLAVAGISMATMAFAADPLANTTWQTLMTASLRVWSKSLNRMVY